MIDIEHRLTLSHGLALMEPRQQAILAAMELLCDEPDKARLIVQALFHALVNSALFDDMCLDDFVEAIDE